MKHLSAVIGLGLVLALAAPARADVSLNSVRIGAVNVEALARFYQAAFGMQEVNRLQVGGNPEIFLNFGATAEAARANAALRLVIMHRDADSLQDPIPHIIFTVTDIAGTVAALKAAGGKMTGDPRPFGNTGIVIGIAIDPAGNQIELIQRKQ